MNPIDRLFAWISENRYIILIFIVLSIITQLWGIHGCEGPASMDWSCR